MMTWLWKRLSNSGAETTVSGRALRRFPDRDVDHLLRAGVLIEQRKADCWAVCEHCDCGIDARPIREIGDAFHACCPHDATQDVILTEDDLLRFRIDSDKLVGAIAASGGLPTLTTMVVDGLWLLGRTPTGRYLFLCRDIHVLTAPSTLMTTRMAAGSAPITIIATDVGLTTELHLRAAGLDARSFVDCVAFDNNGKERLALDRLSPPAATVARLVLSRSRQSALFDGRRLDLTPQMFALIRLLAEQAGKRDNVLRKETMDAQTGRPANEIVRDLRKALIGCGLSKETVESLIVTVRGYGYRLGLDAAEVSIED